MRKTNIIQFFLSLFIITSPALCLAATGGGDDSDREIAALRQWITSKRLVTINERGGNFSISGDIRTKFAAINEVKDGIRQRGENSANPAYPNNDYNVEANLMYDYRTDFTWATIKVEYDNAAGIFHGTGNRLDLERAFLGFRVLDADTYTFDFEVGRRKLGYTFDSKIQYKALMDGVLLKLNTVSERFGDFYIYGGPFVVNDRIHQYAYIGEAGFYNLFNSGLYTKLSFVDWDTKKQETEIDANRFRFQNIQSLWGYRFVPPQLGKVVIPFVAFVNNIAAKGVEQTYYRKDNWAWYMGVSIGEIRKRGDWAFEWNYQWMQPQAVPDFDMDGIGRGNASNTGFYSVGPNGTGGTTTAATAVGKGNYEGWQAELLYLISNTITVSQSFKISDTLDKGVGPLLRYKQYRLEFIYGF